MFCEIPVFLLYIRYIRIYIVTGPMSIFSFILCLNCLIIAKSFVTIQKSNGVCNKRKNEYHYLNEDPKVMELQTVSTSSTFIKYSTGLNLKRAIKLDVSYFFLLLSALMALDAPYITSNNNYELPNHFINYGHYCGPGPANPFQGPEPIDAIDRICQGHDQRYKICLTEYELPTGTSQAVAIRGYLPWGRNIAQMLPAEFNLCIHDADVYFVTNVKEIKQTNKLPKWWDDTGLAPKGAEGVKGYKQACAVGLNNGICMLSSKTVFSELAVDMFSAGIEADQSSN